MAPGAAGRGAARPAIASTALRDDRRQPLPALTGIRAFAAFGPILWHAQHFADRLLPVARHGYLGVDFFFMLSGFVLAYVHGAEMRRPDRLAYGRFLGLRLARIWPAYVAVLLAVGAAVAWRGGFDPLRFLLHLLMLQNWGLTNPDEFNWPAWSVSAEWLVYLLFPLFVLGLGRAGRRAALLGIPALAALLAAAFLAAGYSHLNATGPIGLLRAVVGFAIGMLLWRLFVEPQARRWNWAATGVAALLLLVLLAIASPARSIGDFLFLPVFAALLLSLAFARGPLAAVCQWRPVVFLGAASYSIYLVHFPLLFLLAAWLAPHRAALPAWVYAAIGMAAAIAAATVVGIALHLAVERPCRRWLRHRLGYADA